MRSLRGDVARVGLVLLVLLGVLFASASFAVAEEEPASPPPAEESSEKKTADVTLDELEQRLTANPSTSLIVLLVRFLPLGIGVVLLIFVYLDADKRRGGIKPPRLPTPPPSLGSLGFALIASAVVMILIPVIVTIVWAQAVGPEEARKGPPMALSMAALGVGGLALACLVVLRRARAGRAASRHRLIKGLGAFCIASALVIPASFVTLLLMEVLGEPAAPQDLVKQAIFDTEDTFWLIATYGVLVAPFMEEAIFRALLYPSLRDALGGGRKGIFQSAVLTSAVFAVIHGSLTALLPLFCLAMVLAYVMERTNSLFAVTVAHMANNLLSFVPIYLLRQGG